MTEIKFNEFWDITLKPYIEYELSKNSSYQVLDTTENFSKKRRDIESLYNTARDDIKKSFMKNHEKLLDRHKIPACLYFAIANAPLIKVFGGSEEKDRVVNAGLALHVSISVLLSFMANGADSEYKHYLETNGLQFPQSKNLDSNESYLVQTIKTLCYAQKRNKMDILMLANIFFMLEAHTDSVYISGKK